MKKLLFSTLCLAAISAQSQVIYDQDFEADGALATMTTYGTDGAVISGDPSVAGFGLGGSTFWNVALTASTNQAVTTSWYSPVVTADNYLITPAISLLTGEGYKLTWKAESFGSASFLDPYEVKISSTGTAKTDFTETLFTNAAGAPNTTGESIEVTIPASYAGEDIYVAFIATGSDDFVIGFDNITVERLADNDIQMVSVNLGEFVAAGTVTIGGTVKNNGANPISSFDVDWNDGTSHSETITASIAPGATYDFTHGTTLAATAGETYAITTCATITDDEVAENNCVETSSFTALDEADRLPLIELFTSSTCPPCYTLNYNGFDGSGLNAGLSANNANDPATAELAVVKYQVNWPGAGDHAWNNDVASRVTAYGISGAPTVVLDGLVPATFNSASATDPAKEVAAYMAISATHSTADGVVTVDVDVNPYISATGATLHIALLDAEYVAGTDASFSNGETEFHHVVRKMLPTAAGTSVNLVAGTAYSLTETYAYNFHPSYPAQGSFDFHSISTEGQEVVVFLQAADGTILNAAISTGSIEDNYDNTGIEEADASYEISMFPNPATENTTIRVNTIETATISIEVFNTVGAIVYSVSEDNATSGEHNYMIDLNNFSSGMYTIKSNINGAVKTSKLSVQ